MVNIGELIVVIKVYFVPVSYIRSKILGTRNKYTFRPSRFHHVWIVNSDTQHSSFLIVDSNVGEQLRKRSHGFQVW